MTRRNQSGWRSDGGQARIAALVIALTMIGWMVVQWLGGRYGWQVRYVFLADLAAGAAFIWALAVTWRVWRKRRQE